MKLERAIEIETIHNDHNPNITDAEREEAHQLGIEAMKYLRHARKAGAHHAPALLAGETKE